MTLCKKKQDEAAAEVLKLTPEYYREDIQKLLRVEPVTANKNK